MAVKSNAPARESETDSGASASPPRSRRLLRSGVIAVIVVALLGLLLFYVPQHVARYLLSSELDELGIAYEGIETLDINPWTRELWLGPVRFGTQPPGRGQLGELGLTLRYNSLLNKRVSIERLQIRGVDVVVTRTKDNARTLNGIPLERFIAQPDAAESLTGEGDTWGAGIDTFELRDSRLIFQDHQRGELEVDVERLTLTEFRTWEPERPGRFELAARVNGIQLNWSGEARPFADNVTLVIDSHTEQVDVPKLVRFTGPWGLDRRDGSYDARLKYELTLFHSGRLEGHTAGIIDIEDADYGRAGVFALAFERAKLDLDIHYTWSESGDLALKGQVSADLGPSSGELAGDTRLAVAAGRIAMSGLVAEYEKKGALRFSVQPDIDLERVAFSGPIEISAGKLLELLALLQSLSAGGAVSTVDTGLGDYAGKSITVPSSDVKLGRLRSTEGAFSLQSIEGQVELDLKSKTELVDVQVAANEKQVTIERLQSVLERFSAKSGQGRFALDTAGSHSLVAGMAKEPAGELKIDAMEAKLGKVGLQAQAGLVSLQLAAASQATGFSSRIYAKQTLPEVRISLGVANAALGQASLDARNGTLRWSAAGDAAVGALTADFAAGEEGSFKSTHAKIEALRANEQLRFTADALIIDGLDLYVKRSLLAALLRDGDAEVATAAPSGDPVAKPGAAPPSPTKERATTQEVDVARVQTLLAKLGYAPGAVDGRMGRRTEGAISDFQRKENMEVDGRLTGRLLDALELRAAKPAESKAVPAPQTDIAKGGRLSVGVGHVSLTGSPVFRFRDDTVTPQVMVDTVFKEVEVQKLDTEKTGSRTDLRVVADVNEFTHVELAGWIAGLEETADLDVEAKVENLQLSTYSPYLVELGGVHIESGQLDVVTAATAKQGALQGQIQLEIDNMAFLPLSKEDAERVSEKIGVPLDTAVSLLQDGEGRIALTLPVSGTVGKPEVDFSPAVNKAIGGVLLQVFPPAMVIAIVEGVAEGGGPTFEPIEFAPGSAALGDAGRRNADAVAKLLAEHPKLSLKVCGRATAQDTDKPMAAATIPAPPAAGGEDQAGQSEDKPVPAGHSLAELAVERMRVVRRYLIQEKGVDAKHLPECRSTFAPDDPRGPRVEILF